MRYWVDTILDLKGIKNFSGYFVTLRDARQACRDSKAKRGHIYRIDEDGSKQLVESYKSTGLSARKQEKNGQ